MSGPTCPRGQRVTQFGDLACRFAWCPRGSRSASVKCRPPPRGTARPEQQSSTSIWQYRRPTARVALVVSTSHGTENQRHWGQRGRNSCRDQCCCGHYDAGSTPPAAGTSIPPQRSRRRPPRCRPPPCAIASGSAAPAGRPAATGGRQPASAVSPVHAVGHFQPPRGYRCLDRKGSSDSKCQAATMSRARVSPTSITRWSVLSQSRLHVSRRSCWWGRGKAKLRKDPLDGMTITAAW
jgi:hypothetical protein